MASVCREAGLSQGIINLHFQSKERLLVETLAFIAEEYRESWEKALRKVDGGPAEKLAALVAVDFKPPVCDRNKLAVWFAFWGESKSRPVYRKICAERDIAYRKEMVAVCAELIEQGGYQGVVAETVAACLSTMTSGCWLDMLTNPRSMSRQQAHANLHVLPGDDFPAALFREEHRSVKLNLDSTTLRMAAESPAFCRGGIDPL